VTATLRRGLYELLLTEIQKKNLDAVEERSQPKVIKLRPAEAADRISWHLARIIERVLADRGEADRVEYGTNLARGIVGHVAARTELKNLLDEAPTETAELLKAVVAIRPDGTPADLAEPLIPLLDTTLLTNAPGEPRVGSQLAAEVESADEIAMVMAFIRYSGLRPLIDVLSKHCSAGKPLRVLTTVYTGSTEARALDSLVALGADVRVSYDTTATRLHAKGWLFQRHSGFSTAYIGSSNLTHSAQQDGLEWNVRVSGARNPSVLEKLSAVFESYWQSPDFEPYVRSDFEEKLKTQSSGDGRVPLSPLELIAQPFQERLLERIAVSRQLGHHRNLLVAATGTGKTVMAALDYAGLMTQLPRARLLFVAHREEILQKSLDTFRVALRDHAFGELWVAGKRPTAFEHVFASIQSLSATGLQDLPADHFDVVIVDEFHHAAAKSYQTLLDHLNPKELLGLTATPERSDGMPILHWFENRIAAELRLWDAIEQHRLSPFAYYGVHDGVDLREVPWRRGRGYDPEGLTSVLTSNDGHANLVVKQVHEYVSDPGKMRALGFCVSVAHAEFMARAFNKLGIPSVAVSADTDWTQRTHALRDLQSARINCVFSVDLFNEGVDVPAVDTVLLLRPTESATLFLQQLGRGLRKFRGKSVCTVLDFVGHHRKEFRFDQRFLALLGGSRAEIIEQIKSGFPFLPAGCHMQLDRVASEIVLDSIKRAIPSRWGAKVEELISIARSADSVSLARFLELSGLELEDVYEANHCWSELREAAGLAVEPPGPHEQSLRRACGRMLHIDDLARIDTWQALLSTQVPVVESLSMHDRRLLRMLVAQMTDSVVSKETSLEEAARILWAHPQVLLELREVLDILRGRINHVQHALSQSVDVPLRVHARYTRIEILAALGVGTAAKPPDWREGVRFVRDARTDVFVFTLDKTSGQFSPTTRYKDYAISRDLIHWESQSTVREDSDTGQRYQNHQSMGSQVMLFARLRNDDRAFWFLGPATYVSHTGERPMAITWKLRHPLSGDLFAQFAAAVA
jgi:superfamily II DNA or RNA helicase/HKD family nuclease